MERLKHCWFGGSQDYFHVGFVDIELYTVVTVDLSVVVFETYM